LRIAEFKSEIRNPKFAFRNRLIRSLPLAVLTRAFILTRHDLQTRNWAASDNDASRVAAGQSLLDPAVTARVLDRIRRGPEQPDELKSLTDQERRILTLIAEGLTNQAIASRLSVAPRTAEAHVENIRRKLEPDPAHPRYLLTVYGVGYRFAEQE